MADKQSPVILCGKCRVSPKSVTGAQGETSIACPICGQQDNGSDAVREALAQALNETMRKGLGPNIKPASNSLFKIVKEGKPISNKCQIKTLIPSQNAYLQFLINTMMP